MNTAKVTLPLIIAARALLYLLAIPMPFLTYQWIGFWGTPVCIVLAVLCEWQAARIYSLERRGSI